MFRTSCLALVAALCQWTTLGLPVAVFLTRMLIKQASRMLALPSPLCYRTTLTLLVFMFPRMLIKRNTRMLTLPTPLCYRTTLTLLVPMFLTRMLIKWTSELLGTTMFLQYILCNIRRQRSSLCLGSLALCLFRIMLSQVVFDLRVFHAAPTFVDSVGSKCLGKFRTMCGCPASNTGKSAIGGAIRVNNWNDMSAPLLDLLV